MFDPLLQAIYEGEGKIGHEIFGSSIDSQTSCFGSVSLCGYLEEKTKPAFRRRLIIMNRFILILLLVVKPPGFKFLH